MEVTAEVVTEVAVAVVAEPALEVVAETESANDIPKASLPEGVVLCRRFVVLLS